MTSLTACLQNVQVRVEQDVKILLAHSKVSSACRAYSIVGQSCLCAFVCMCVCVCVNPGTTSYNCCMWRHVILHPSRAITWGTKNFAQNKSPDITTHSENAPAPRQFPQCQLTIRALWAACFNIKHGQIAFGISKNAT